MCVCVMLGAWVEVHELCRCVVVSLCRCVVVPLSLVEDSHTDGVNNDGDNHSGESDYTGHLEMNII